MNRLQWVHQGLLIGLLAFLLSCAGKTISPDEVAASEQDQQQSQVQATLETRPLRILIVGNRIEEPRQAQVRAVLEDIFWRNGGLFSLEREASALLVGQPHLMKAFETAQRLEADYLLVAQKETLEGDAQLRLTLFEVKSSDIALEHRLDFPPQEDKALAKKIQTLFPKRGVVLETKGSGAYARISLGRASGLKLGQEVALFVPLQPGAAGGQAAQTAKAKGEVVKLAENDAWVKLLGKVPAPRGELVQTLPNSSWF